MTVCAAAICTVKHTIGGHYAVLGISDRMFTSGDLEYETKNQTKIFALPPTTIVLGAGDTAVNYTVFRETEKQFNRNMDVSTAAMLHADNFVAFRKRFLERKYLTPLGIGTDEFVASRHFLNNPP